MLAQQRVAILLASFNGELFISEQLRSIAAQNDVRWDLWVSDDGSSDSSVHLLQSFAQGFSDPQVLLADALPDERLTFFFRGPGKGPANNFFYLIETVFERAFRHYQAFAFADQDDIWFSNKLSTALEGLNRPSAIAKCGSQAPLLWCTAVRWCDSQGGMGSELPSKISETFVPSLHHALTQNIVRGNTSVLNREAFEQIYACRPRFPVVMHDWWFYIVITASPGGKILYDPVPSLAYRQHASNQIGEALSWAVLFERRRRAWQGEVMKWNDTHIRALRDLQGKAQERLDAALWQALEALEQVCRLSREGGFLQRLKALRLVRAAKLRRMRRLQNIFMDLLILAGRF